MCSECGFDYATPARSDLPDWLRDRADEFRAAFARLDPQRLRDRPSPGVWSPLEYACHVRDVMQVQRERIWLAVVETQPEFASMRREDRAIEDDYNAQDPAAVSAALVEGAGLLADAFAALDDDGWNRTGVYHERGVRTVEWIGRHTVHELVHHTFDITRA
jgi:S-DNA-T family DNA segregation ATPase FtsK/SpoIIIE